MDDSTANLVANFASGGLGMALDQISRTALPSRRKDPPPPRPPCPFKVSTPFRLIFTFAFEPVRMCASFVL
ncbi:hypothetical protein DAPPUDRAFT_238307 [Daphnia pulex]|uniref:Uncharacterized protein n=1 Tax=Daphnia pulex TaxID=6669 RepID=E9G629_DAPPU|nr:hypothetical protein DAPPUDRAFT_238307 [Daphnia pulex]|eukprot:EFX85067.1 hypothetical protein DAPPUDRAFT_238307 [Daphnia pulex]